MYWKIKLNAELAAGQGNITVLAGDVGGTKTRLAIMVVDGDLVRTQHEASFPSQRYDKFETLLGEFLSGIDCLPPLPHWEEEANKSLRKFYIPAAFGVAGPVQGRVVQTTNLPWLIDAEALQQQFGLTQCTLLNDLEATAYGLPALGAEDLLSLQSGMDGAAGNAAVIAAGTGLGEAGLFWDGKQHLPFATEGGHASFAPANTLEFALLRHLQQKYQHVSWERVVSGMGLVDMHDFLRQYRNKATPDWLLAEMQSGDAAAAISGAVDKDGICREVMQLFVRLYGAEAGNLALKLMSRGGLYLGGGIAPKILTMLQSGEFIEAFLNKGRMRPLLEAMSVKVILNDRAALYGPALYAAGVIRH